MNLVLLQKEDFTSNGRVKLQDRRYVHIRNVLQACPGDQIQVGLLGGKMGTGTIAALSPDSIEVDIHLSKDPPQALPLTLILAMPRPKVFKRVLQAVTALGVKRIFLINSWRVDKSYWKSPVLDAGSLLEHQILGLEQARDTILPTVEIQQRFKPFVEDSLPDLARGAVALLAHPYASRPCPANVKQQAVLVIGPEGGFTDYEVGKMIEAGLTAVQLGTRSLRVETAVPALIGRLHPGAP